MMLQKRINRAFEKQREDREERDKMSQEAVYMQMMADVGDETDVLEKGDLLAMILAAFRVLLLPSLLILAGIAGIGLLLFG